MTFFGLEKFASPKYLYEKTYRWMPWISTLAALLLLIGLWGGLFIAPPDYQQGDGFRIIYIHVPSAFLAMGIYMMMAISAIIALVWRIKIANVILQSAVTMGAWFTFLALFTGAVWGKPMWGTWWIWDARLTSVLILLFIYLGILALRSAIDNQALADKSCAILTLVGLVNIPIIHYSVIWWNTLHQGPSITRFGKPTIEASMLWPLLVMIAAFSSMIS